MQKINFKLDWFSCMFSDQSIENLMRWLKLDPSLYIDEFLLRQAERSQGMVTKTFFSFEGVSFEVDSGDFLKRESDEFDSIYSRVRVDISGGGLEFLRSQDIDIDSLLRDSSGYPGMFNVTRCDFTFDLVNYQPEFLDRLLNYVSNNLTPDGRVAIYKRPGGIKCEYHIGSRKVLYLGSTTGKQMLRCYDKRLQYVDLKTGLYVKENSYDNPDSWIRLELQTRRERSEQLLFGKADNFGLSVFRYIFEQYKFADVENTTKQNREPADFWLQLFDWNTIPEIIQNENCKKFVTYSEKVIGDAQRMVGRIARDLAVIASVAGGREAVQTLFNNYFSRLFDYSDVSVQRHREAYVSQLNVLLAEGSLFISDSVSSCDFGFYRDLGRIYFKF